MRHLVVFALAGAFLVAGCSTIEPLAPPAVNGGSANFGTYVALGTSLADGVESGGSVDRHQVYSYAQLFARQVGCARFDRQLIGGDGQSLDGTQPLLQIVSLSPLVISSAGRTLGAPLNSAFPGDFHNLGVPGALVSDVTDTSTYYLPARANAHFAHVVRHKGSIAQVTARISPTFVTFEYGSNEVIGSVTRGSGTPFFDVPTFTFLLDAALDAVLAAAPTAKLALFNVPDPTVVPFATAFPPLTRDNTGAITSLRVQTSPSDTLPGGGTPIGQGGRVLLTAGSLLAQGWGFPTNCVSYVSGAPGNGKALPDAVVLTSAEVTSLRSAQAGYNGAIAAEAGTRGAALVDFAGVFQQAATTGLTYNGHTYTAAFMTGGLFSLDGVHPTDQGYGFMANALIDAVNAKFGSNVQHVDIVELTATNSSRMRPTSPRGPVYPIIENAADVYARMFPLPPGHGR